MRTPAEREEWLVEMGANRFVDTYLSLMKRMSQGGRLPGMNIPTKDELLAIYRQTTPEYWLQLAATQPAEAQAQYQQFAEVEEDGNDRGNDRATDRADNSTY